MKTTNGNFFLKSLFIAIMTTCFVLNIANGAPRVAANRVSAKKSNVTTQTPVQVASVQETEYAAPEEIEEPIIIENKSSNFESAINAEIGFSDSSSNNSEFAEQIRKQRAAAEARDSLNIVDTNQKSGLKNGKNACDGGLRECMQKICGKDFTKCATDGDTDFGDKLNKCRRETECTGHEFQLFTTEIKADRDFNVRMSSYQSVIDCGNSYNLCIQNECGATFGKCLGKTAADNAMNKCATIAKNCMEQDSGLSARFGSVIGRLREDAEKDVKADEERMYTLRDLMSEQCKRLGAMFDERSFDCVFTVNFFAGENQDKPTASRKRYAGDTFVCTQEWFGTNVTTFKENAYRETRAQTAASSAMLGSGVGTAAGLITSGAMGRSIDAAKAKKELKKEEKADKGETPVNACKDSVRGALLLEDEGKRQKLCNKTKGCDPKPNAKDPGKTDCICMHGTAEFRVDSKCKLVLDITPNEYGTTSTKKPNGVKKTKTATEAECAERAKTDKTCKWENNQCKCAGNTGTASTPAAGTGEFDIYTGEAFTEFQPPAGYTNDQLEKYIEVNCTCDNLGTLLSVRAPAGNCTNILPSKCNGYTSDIGKGTCNFEGHEDKYDTKLCKECQELQPRYVKCINEINSWCKQHEHDREASCKAWNKKRWS